MDNIKKFGLELFFPSFCLGCKKEGVFLCQDCKSTLEISEYNYCLCNKNPLRLIPENQTGKCQRCADKKLSGLYFALPYEEKFLTRKLVYQFKYPPYIKGLAKTLAEILLEHFALAKIATKEVWKNSMLIPVPLEIKKQKSRGYNQAEELVKELGQNLYVPSILGNLVKIKATEPQMELSAKERQENLVGAFSVLKPEEIKDKKIFLVDDVYTTGATMEECAKTLKEAGAKSVWGIAIAREG